jgi:hypothetical protein
MVDLDDGTRVVVRVKHRDGRRFQAEHWAITAACRHPEPLREDAAYFNFPR